jgi:hypothetical protein
MVSCGPVGWVVVVRRGSDRRVVVVVVVFAMGLRRVVVGAVWLVWSMLSKA